MKLDVLFFAAHPDDIELSCGGTAAILSRIGKKTGIIDLTRGELGTRGSEALRKKEAEKARQVLGAHTRINLAIPDGNIQNTPANRTKIIKVIREFKPEIIFFPHFYDRHPDHSHTHELVKEAAFYSGLSKIKTSVGGKSQAAHRPKKNFYFMQTYTFDPNIIIDISKVYDIKVRAINCFESQFSEKSGKGGRTFISDPKFIKFIEARARFYGFKIGAEYGEPFFTEEILNVKPKDLFSI